VGGKKDRGEGEERWGTGEEVEVKGEGGWWVAEEALVMEWARMRRVERVGRRGWEGIGEEGRELEDREVKGGGRRKRGVTGRSAGGRGSRWGSK